jgi:hypothetical protein
MAMSLTSRQLVWIKGDLEELQQLAQFTVASDNPDLDYYLLDDNQGALELARNPRLNTRTKHIDVHYHFVRERLEAGHFELIYIPTGDNLADLLTKNLPKPRHHELSDKVRCFKRGGVL